MNNITVSNSPVSFETVIAEFSATRKALAKAMRRPVRFPKAEFDANKEAYKNLWAFVNALPKEEQAPYIAQIENAIK